VDLFNGAIQVVIYKNNEPTLLDIQGASPLIAPPNCNLRNNELTVARYVHDWWIEQQSNGDNDNDKSTAITTTATTTTININQIKSSVAMVVAHTKSLRPTITYEMASLNTPYINFTGQVSGATRGYI
jgi:hypothetical protein